MSAASREYLQQQEREYGEGYYQPTPRISHSGLFVRIIKLLFKNKLHEQNKADHGKQSKGCF